MTTALFLLRATEMGLSMDDLDSLSIGMVADMIAEKNNVDYEWPVMATQEDMDKF